MFAEFLKNNPNYSMCGACKAPVERISGCPHLTCGQCRAHFCLFCGNVFDIDYIYTHISMCPKRK